jgi:Lrp/AsnC family transcriptional regulator, leucine-responsive regulatory protein
MQLDDLARRRRGEGAPSTTLEQHGATPPRPGRGGPFVGRQESRPDRVRAAIGRRGTVRLVRRAPLRSDVPLRRSAAPYDTALLDERDLEIIAALQDDGRATYADIGQRVGLAASSVHDRVRKLERLGAIRGYRAVVDPEAVGLFVTALIAVTPLDPTQPDDLPDRVRDFPEVEDCLSVAGEANYVLKVRTKTTGHLEELIRRLREKGEVQTRTTVVLSIPFEGRPTRP